jgi:selenide,water dikinase
MEEINDKVFNFKLLEGYSAETSGGLFLMCPPDKANLFMEDLKKNFGQQSWIIGSVI